MKVLRPVLLGTILLLSACASGAVPGAMVPPVSQQTLIGDTSRLRQGIEVSGVTGGRETNPLWTSQVSNEAFSEALRQSLAIHALLSSNNAPYRLDAQLFDMAQPLMGFNMTVRARARYRLARVADGSVVHESEVDSSFTATAASSALGVERLRLANEGAIRENIRQFLEKLIAAEANDPDAFRVRFGA